MLEAQQCTFWTVRKWFMETSLFVDNARISSQLDHGVAHLGSRAFVQRDANNTETVLFTIFFVFVPDRHKTGECSMTVYIARSESVHIPDKLHWCHGNVIYLVHNA